MSTIATSGEYLDEIVGAGHERRVEELRRVVDEGLAGGISTRTFEARIAEGDRIIQTRYTSDIRR
jgi:fermentation-respiration switch protein FrsA (DUF1100 family)